VGLLENSANFPTSALGTGANWTSARGGRSSASGVAGAPWLQAGSNRGGRPRDLNYANLSSSRQPRVD
jgi:hypothetical protein